MRLVKKPWKMAEVNADERSTESEVDEWSTEAAVESMITMPKCVLYLYSSLILPDVLNLLLVLLHN